MKKLLFLLSLTFASAILAHAQRIEVEPIFGYRFGGEVQDAYTGETYSFKDSEAYGMFVDIGATNSDLKIELLWSRQDTSLDLRGAFDQNVNMTIDEFQIGGVAETGTSRFREYLSAHVGATYIDTDGFGSDTRFSLGLGAGAKWFITPHIVLRADLRGFCTVVDAEGGFMYSNGITVATFSGSSIWQGQASVGAGIAF